MDNRLKRDLVHFKAPADLTEQFIQKINSLSSSVKSDYLKKEFLSKYVSHDTEPPLTRRNSAIRKWLAAERDNEATNVRLYLTPEDYNILPRVSYCSFMKFCTKLVIRVIGEVPPIEALIGSFSGGASTSRARTVSHPATKYVGEAHVTPDCLDWFNLLEVELPLWLGDGCSLQKKVVPGNVLFTVPKKSDIDRVACKEPDLNMFIQKGVGAYFRKRLLRRAKINLNDQSINRSLAHLGSVTNELSTLDLSSASDSVTTELVFSFLPVTWFALLNSIRSRVTIIDGEEHRNEMFSSMGNGFTFELESLLFWVITEAVAHFKDVPGSISVYGDDIICPRGISDELTFVLGFFGFQVNPDKSCYSGPYRESCGGHYWNGVDITPFYLKKPLESMTDIIDVANKLRRWSELWIGTDTMCSVLDPEVEGIWLWLKSFIPKALWGGVDTTYKYQLVSQDTPSYRLSEESVKKGTGYGGYLHWHNATWERADLRDAISTSSRSVSLGRVRVKKARPSTVDRLHSLFLHEIEKTSDQ